MQEASERPHRKPEAPICCGVSQWMQDPTSSSPRPGSLMPEKEGGGQKLGFYERKGSNSWDISPELHLEEEKNLRKKIQTPPPFPRMLHCYLLSLIVKREGKTPWFCWGIFYPQH